MKIVLVPTIIRGVNDHMVGDFIRFAARNVDVVTGISAQPLCFTGRINAKDRELARYTLSDFAHDAAEQAGLGDPHAEWFPLAAVQPFAKLLGAMSDAPTMTITCHPHCSIGTYLFVDPDGALHPLARFLDFEPFLREVDARSRRMSGARVKILAKAGAWNRLRKYFHEERAPKGLTFGRLLHTFDGYQDRRLSRDDAENRKHIYPNFFVAGMHFQDGYNFNVERVRRCVIHYAAPDGRLYPFCTYNSGPCFRERVEPAFRWGREETLALIEREGCPRELMALKRSLERGD